jgi:hypothetical protein
VHVARVLEVRRLLLPRWDRWRQDLVAGRPEPLTEGLVKDLPGRRELEVVNPVDRLAIDQALEGLGIAGVASIAQLAVP